MNNVGVIISSGYGAGWSTWNDNTEFLATDPTLVSFCEQEATVNEVEEYLKSKGHTDVYMGGWGQCIVTADYDGYESIIYLDSTGFTL